MEGSPDPAEAGPCTVTVEWDTKDPDRATQDDPTGNAASVAAEPYIEMYSSYCAARKYQTGRWHMPCYKKYVLKYDGNGTWNYYSIESWNSCQAEAGGPHYQLTSCGRGQQITSPAVSWVDYAPDSSSSGNCRPVNITVALGYLEVGGSYDHCEEQRVYLYPEAGKMSSYWKGAVDGYNLRTTRHQASVKVGQDDGRPVWSNWFNTQAQECDAFWMYCWDI